MIGVIFNPSTNKGNSVGRMKKILAIMDGRGVEYVYRESRCRGDVQELANEMSDTCDTIVLAGGDGTVYEGVNGSIGRDVSYFVLPLGSGNDISRSLGLCDLSNEQLIDVLLNGTERGFDCAVMNGGAIMTEFVSFGIVTRIIDEFNRRKRSSPMAYYSTGLKAVRMHRESRFRVRTDNIDREFDIDFLSLQNIKFAGGGMMICPVAEDDDRTMDLVVVEHMGLRRKVMNAVALIRGRLLDQPNVHSEKTKWAEMIPVSGNEVCCIDGELFTTDGVRAELYHKQLRFICAEE